MNRFIPLILVFFTTPAFAESMLIQINPNRMCAAIVGIPYASDNFSDEEWEEFKECVNYFYQYKDIE